MNQEIINVRTILLVEDDHGDATMTLAALKTIHLADQVTVVRDGAEALDYLYYRGKYKLRGGGEPILVLLDNKMPKVSGLEVLKIMKADGHLKRIPVVAFTSSRLKSDLIAFYEAGVNAYVVKPVDFTEFETAVKQIGIFWAAANEPPPVGGRSENRVQNGEVTFPEKTEVANDNLQSTHREP